MGIKLGQMSVEKYLLEAERSLEGNDLIGFISNINRGMVLAEDNEKLYAEATYLNAKGLYRLRQYEKALDAIHEALQYNEGVERIRLFKYKGLIFGSRGHFEEAIHIFKELLQETEDNTLKAELYINLAWANLTYFRVCNQEPVLEEAKKVLDRVNNYFDQLHPKLRKQILNNYSDYYWQKKDYDQAMKMLEDVMEYCDERDLPEVYNSLAELHLIFENLDLVKKYVNQAEVIANRYGNSFEIGQALYIRGMAEVKAGDLIRGKDAFHVALTYFCSAQAYTYAFKSFKKLLEIAQMFHLESIDLLQQTVKTHFKDTPYYGEFEYRKEGVI